MEDIRWKQRFANFDKAFAQFKKFIEKGILNEMEEQGLIKSFEYTFELAWNVMKDYFEYQGDKDIQGSRDAIRLAFKRNLISDGEAWMDMIKSRVLAAHTYDQAKANEILFKIQQVYYGLFTEFHKKMTSLL